LSLRPLLVRAQQDWRVFAAVFALVAAVFVGFGVWVYTLNLESILHQQYAHLNGLGSDQAKELTVWQRERLDEGRRLQKTRYAESAVNYLRSGTEDAGWSLLLDDMRLLLAREHYESIFLLDRRGRVRFTLGPVPFRARLLADGPAVVRSGRAGFFAYGEGAAMRVVLLTPLVDGQQHTAGAVGFVLLPQADFGQFISPGIPFGADLAGLPLGEGMAEVLVVAGDRVVAPHPERHPRIAFKNRVSRGDPRFFSALDERGVAVVAEELAVPGTSWSVVTRVERRGFNAQPMVLTFWAVAVLLVFVATTGGITYLVWKWVDARRRLAETAAQRELARLEQRFDYLAKYANDAIVLADEQHRIVEVNDKALELYGYTREEFRGMDLAQLRAPEALARFEHDWGDIRTKPSIIFEALHRTRAGRTFPAEVSARAIPVNSHREIQAIIRDTSERKRVEAQVRRQAKLYAALSRTNEAITRYTSEARLLPEICRIVAEVGGFAEVYVAMAENGSPRITARCGALEPGAEPGANVGDSVPEPLLTAFRTGRPEYVNDYVNDRRTAVLLKAATRGIASAAAFPLRRFERVAGVLGVSSLEPNIFDEALLRLLQDMALDVSLGLEGIEREQRRLLSERLLRDNELRYRSLFENMGSGVLVMVRDEADGFLVKDVNAAFAAMEGSSRGEMVGRRVREVFEWAPHCLLPVADEVWRDGEPKPVPAHCHAGAHGGWRESYIYRLPTDELVTVIEDVTARVEAMEQLRRSEERLALVLEGTSAAYWDFNFENSEVFYSRRFAELFGYTVEELGASFDSWQRLVHPNDLVQVQRELADHLAGKTEQFVSEHRMRHKDRGYLWVRARGRVVRRGTDGQPLRMAGTHSDITADREREETLREWAAVFEQSREAIIITDAQRRIVSVNRAFTEITGYSQDEVLARDPRMLASGVHDRAFYQTLWSTIEQSGHWQGEIQDRRKDGEIFPLWLAITAAKDAHGQVRNYVAIASDISGSKETEERIRHLAYHDALTRLPNRTLFSDRLSFVLSHAHRHHYAVAVLFLDLDRFKEVNDRFGYGAGDRLLVQAAERLRAGLRRDDTVARQGGDEFLVLFSELDQPEDAMFGARKMLEDLARPYAVDGGEAKVTASIGIALYPRDGTDGDTLLRHADAALYHAKERGRNNFQFWSEELNQRAGRRFALEERLRHAVDAGEFVLHYQPKVALESGAPVGAEALLRWRSDGALMKPAEFLPLAEETGVVAELGAWVMREACRQQAAWRAAGLPQVPVAINVSAGELRQRGWLERVRGVVGECAGGIELELDERVLLQEAPAVGGTLRSLRELGVGIALDNFGGAGSSLGSLRHFPVQHLKLDRSLVCGGEGDGAVAGAVVTLARQLGIRVVAQGVEDAGGLRMAREQQCDEAQGSFLAPPLDAQAFADWWKSRL
jgi:diguanylate cyclase (GGDEF)-like protein/PAS domain S-box-containing protein